ncbi:hypothetical protein FF125_16065 [Aureibaculum algae]|uniref:DUF2116 family Zn-ribbon domain-containing protein n=1 Tax=Aureibaculum algae TaxID=2584122 RepID=A0A5B7TUH6_9FLAO|nr:hypothetical protein [Aureibaculum algae]QCX39030.1 hypothetical protein FF125_11510 [Aureibaculum algae]QCX39878.1 hypothetical protein FF125_16065 [Aureibaculum algae]
MKLKKICLSCNKELKGRSDKKFCDQYCKSAYHYKLSQEQAPKFFNQVDNQLKLNRKILKEYNKAGKATVRAEIIIDLGFDPNFFTHYWKNQKGDVYLFVYEYGFLSKKENGRKKIILILWQEYMNHNKFKQ